ncbi:MAG: ribonucleoside-diphosphate reductase subunit alpha, partial [Verrucomicrobiota bacterium]
MDLHGVDPLASREFEVLKRDGRTEKFNDQRILLAIESAFKAEQGLKKEQSLDDDTHHQVEAVTQAVVEAVLVRAVAGDQLEIEAIQDAVEDALMNQGHHTVARRYIVYREDRRKARALRGERDRTGKPLAQLTVKTADGEEPLDPTRIRRRVIRACKQAEEINPDGRVHSRGISDEALRNLYDGVSTDEIDKAVILAARARIEAEPDYTYVAANLLLDVIYREVLPEAPARNKLAEVHSQHFVSYLHAAIRCDRLSESLLDFDLGRISKALDLSRDLKFQYIGLQTIYDRYLIHHEERRLETPQYFWMRVAMGLASGEEGDKTARAIEFYDMLSTFRFVSSTPTLFNSGTLHPQLSSCYLSTVMDDLEHIFKVISDDARLSKWAGGLGNDWTNVRATGAHIKGTNGRSQGVVPFLKVANDTAVAVNQGGKRKGAMCAYLETWHLDIENFLELRKNTGDERRRTHDMNTANWIPDLFMKRVAENGEWTLFDPSEVPDLHDLYGQAFEQRYAEYEAMAEKGQMKLSKKVEAVTLWRKMLTMVFETGHPWITFKDPSNVRSPQSHAGVVHSSNLCTEILLNTSVDEIAVCNLGSVNLAEHMKDGKLDEEKLAETVRTAMRMLDNVIDINYYPTPEARNANLRHRPVGLGLMGFQDALYEMKVPYASLEAIDFADYCMEAISYHAILSSSQLAGERGAYSTFEGSKWDQGLLPLDTLDLLEQERGGYLEVDRSSKLDWTPVRKSIKKYGMRNSNTMAIAPTATIANITGATQSIEP